MTIKHKTFAEKFIDTFGFTPVPSGELTEEQLDYIISQIPVQDLSGKVDKETGKALLAVTEAAKIHSPGSDNQDLSGLVGTDDERLSDPRPPTTHTHPYEPVNSNIQTHVTSAHAPANAQPNNISDVNAALLTGGQETDLHSHPGGGGGLTQQQIEGMI